MRMCISAVFVALGITNCIILLNRVTPFGFTDISMIGDLLTMQNTNYFTSQQAAISVVALFIIYTLDGPHLYQRQKVKAAFSVLGQIALYRGMFCQCSGDDFYFAGTGRTFLLFW